MNNKEEKINEAKNLKNKLDELLKEIGLEEEELEEEELEEGCNNKGGCKCGKKNKLANPDSKMIKYG